MRPPPSGTARGPPYRSLAKAALPLVDRVDHGGGTRLQLGLRHEAVRVPAAHEGLVVAAQRVPTGYNAFAYVIDGAGLFGVDRERAGDGQMVLFAQDGDEVRIENPADAQGALDVLLIGGLPLHEPIARYGPFVMNTKAEIYQAIEDYREGRMGAITADN